MSLELPLQQSAVQALGWSLLHFVWQGAVIAAVLALVLIALRQASAHVRYLVQCAALLLMVACPVITSLWLIGNTEAIALPERGTGTTRAAPPRVVISPAERANESPMTSQPLPSLPPWNATVPEPGRMVEERLLALATKPAPVSAQRAAAVPGEHTWQRWIEPLLPWMVTCWLLGVCVLSVRLLLGWRFIQRIKRLASAPAVEDWHQPCRQLAARLKISRPVRLLESALIEVPTVIGWLRPMILLPASAFTGLEPAQLEAILAHELAHIRRHDYLVNLIQTALETLLFYHPAVWWVSRQIRDEREHCCDDIAVELCGNRVTYVRALAEMEELRASPRLTLAMNSGSLLGRIRRLVYPSFSTPESVWWSASPIVIALIGGLLTLGYVSASKANPAKPPLKFGGEHHTPPLPVALLEEQKSPVTPKVEPSPLDKKVDEALKRVEKIHLVVGVFSVEHILQALEGIGSTAMLQKTRQELELMKALDWLADGAVYNGPAWIKTADGVREKTGRQRAPLEAGKLLSYLASAKIPADFKLKAADEKGELQPITVQDLIAEAKERADDLGEMSHLLSALAHYEPLQSQWTKKHGDRWSLMRLTEQVLIRRNGYDTGYSRIWALSILRQRLREAEATLDESQRKLAAQIDQEIAAFVKASKEVQASDGSMFNPLKRGERVRDENERRYLTGGRLVCLVETLSKQQLKEDWIQRTVDYVARDLIEFKPDGAGTNWIFRSARALRLYRDKMKGIAAAEAKQPTLIQLASAEKGKQTEAAPNNPAPHKRTWAGIDPQEIVTLRESLASQNQQVRDQAAVEIRRKLTALRSVFKYGIYGIAWSGFGYAERNDQIEVVDIDKESRAAQQKEVVVGDVLVAVRNSKGEMENVGGSIKKYVDIVERRPFDVLKLRFRSKATKEYREVEFAPAPVGGTQLEQTIRHYQQSITDQTDNSGIGWLPSGMKRAEVLASLKLTDADSRGSNFGIEYVQVFDNFLVGLSFDRMSNEFDSARVMEIDRPIDVKPTAQYSGKWRTYVNNGVLHQQAEYQNGQLHGQHQTYYPNGSVSVLKHYRFGKAEGEQIEYSQSGKMQRIGQNSDDNRVGIWANIKEDGTAGDVVSFSGSPAVFAKVDGEPAAVGNPVDARCELSGHVLDRKGRLVKGAKIQVWRMDGVRKVDLLAGRKNSVVTDEDGHFEIQGLTEGEATVAATFDTGADSSEIFAEYKSVLLVSRYQAYCRCQLYAPVVADADEKYLTAGGPYKSVTWSNFKFDPKSMQAAGQTPAIGRSPLAWGEIRHGLQAAIVLSPDAADANARAAQLVIRNTLTDRLIALQRHKVGENFAFEIIKPDATVEVITRDIWPLNKMPLSHTSNEIYLRPGDEYELSLGSLKHAAFGDIQKGTSVRAHLTLFSEQEPRDKSRGQELFPTTTMETAWVPIGDGTSIDRQAPLVQLVVVDEKSGQPVPDFTMIPGTEGSLGPAGDPNALAQWQPHMLMAGKVGRSGWPQSRTYEFMRLRIEADGYRPALSQLIRKADGPLTVLVKLVADPGLDGRVISPTGQLIAFAQVGVAMPARTIQIVDRRIHLPQQIPADPADQWRLPLVVETNEHGRFHLPPEVSPAMVVAVHESGYAEVRRDELTATSPTIVLQPWGRVEGQLLWGDRPGPDETISLSTSRPSHDWIPLVSQSVTTKTDAQGRFTFEHVPRGLAQISRNMTVANPTATNFTSGHLFPIMHVNVRSSGPTPVVLGGKGQPVIGKLQGLNDWQGVTVRIFPNAPRPGDQFLWTGYSQFSNSPEGKLYHRDKIPVNSDGTFRIENVPTAYYQWQAIGPKNEYLAGGKITIPALPGGASDEPFDLKTVSVKPLKGGG